MALTQKQKTEVQQMISDSLELINLNYKIVQELPNLPKKNTLYFLQVSVNPKLFKLYHTDKDGDLATLTI